MPFEKKKYIYTLFVVLKPVVLHFCLSKNFELTLQLWRLYLQKQIVWKNTVLLSSFPRSRVEYFGRIFSLSVSVNRSMSIQQNNFSHRYESRKKHTPTVTLTDTKHHRTSSFLTGRQFFFNLSFELYSLVQTINLQSN